MSSGNNGRSAEKASRLSRRRLLQTTGVAGLGLVAGCSSKDGTTTSSGGAGTGDSSGNTNGGSGETVIDEIMSTSTIPPELHWNQFAADGWSGNLAGWAFDFGARLFAANGETKLMAYDDWEYHEENNVLRKILRDDVKYWNGNQYTADDLYAVDEIYRLLSPETSKWTKIEKVDDLTLDYYYREPQNPDLLKKTELTSDFMDLGTEIWGDWLKKFQNASSQDERDELNKQLTEFKVPHDEFMEKGLGTSPYKLETVTQQEVVFRKWDGHRHADDIEIEEFRRQFADSSAREDQMVKNDKIDFARAPLSSQLKGVVPDYIQNLVTWEGKWMIKMLVNWRNRDYLKDVNVRRAMAAALDTENVALNYGRGLPVKVHSGMDSAYTKQYVGDASNDYIDYGTKANYELADEYLKKAGYSRENGTVLDPDGNELDKLRFVAGTAKTWYNPAQTASAQLNEYGFPVEFTAVERSTKLDRITEPEQMDSWDLSTESHYAGGTYHPISYFNWGTFWGWRLGHARWGPEEGVEADIEQWISDGKKNSPYNGKVLVPEVPKKVGAADLSGATESVNILELYKEANTPISEQRTKEIISKLSWAWNFYLPDIDLMTAQQGVWGDTKNFAWPEDTTPLTGVNGGGVYYTLKNGLVKPKNE